MFQCAKNYGVSTRVTRLKVAPNMAAPISLNEKLTKKRNVVCRDAADIHNYTCHVLYTVYGKHNVQNIAKLSLSTDKLFFFWEKLSFSSDIFFFFSTRAQLKCFYYPVLETGGGKKDNGYHQPPSHFQYSITIMNMVHNIQYHQRKKAILKEVP